MATLTVDKRYDRKPSYDIRWVEGKIRRTLHLGGSRFNRKTAERVKDIVERLLHYRWSPDTVPDKMTMHWLQHAPQEIRDKLARAGLIAVEERKTCQMLWDTYMKHKTDLKSVSIKNYSRCQLEFFEAFRPTEPIDKITSERLLEWKARMLTKFAPATVALYLTLARAVFSWAVRHDWLTKSPMLGIKAGSFENRAKDRIITMEEYGKLLEACPSQEWRTIIALARIGGLRCPSELMQLRWTDIDWKNNRFLVRSPKTERHAGRGEREVPLFSELWTELEKHRLLAENNEFVIQSFQGSGWGMINPFNVISKAAGLGVIVRPFDNMRMSRSNEVLRRWGNEKESRWIGHTSEVMGKHYFQLSDDDFADAAK